MASRVHCHIMQPDPDDHDTINLAEVKQAGYPQKNVRLDIVGLTRRSTKFNTIHRLLLFGVLFVSAFGLTRRSTKFNTIHRLLLFGVLFVSTFAQMPPCPGVDLEKGTYYFWHPNTFGFGNSFFDWRANVTGEGPKVISRCFKTNMTCTNHFAPFYSATVRLQPNGKVISQMTTLEVSRELPHNSETVWSWGMQEESWIDFGSCQRHVNYIPNNSEIKCLPLAMDRDNTTVTLNCTALKMYPDLVCEFYTQDTAVVNVPVTSDPLETVAEDPLYYKKSCSVSWPVHLLSSPGQQTLGVRFYPDLSKGKESQRNHTIGHLTLGPLTASEGNLKAKEVVTPASSDGPCVSSDVMTLLTHLTVLAIGVVIGGLLVKLVGRVLHSRSSRKHDDVYYTDMSKVTYP